MWVTVITGLWCPQVWILQSFLSLCLATNQPEPLFCSCCNYRHTLLHRYITPCAEYVSGIFSRWLKLPGAGIWVAQWHWEVGESFRRYLEIINLATLILRVTMTVPDLRWRDQKRGKSPIWRAGWGGLPGSLRCQDHVILTSSWHYAVIITLSSHLVTLVTRHNLNIMIKLGGILENRRNIFSWKCPHLFDVGETP